MDVGVTDMLGILFAALLAAGFLCAAFTGNMEALSSSALDAAKESVSVCIGMAGGYVLFMGLINILSEAGAVEKLSKGVFAVAGRLFTGVKKGSAAAKSISLNLAANMLGIGNAATPYGLAAMKELQALNPEKTRATDAMCMFLVINASSIQLIPLNVIALRAQAGSVAPASVVLPALFATAISTAVGILAALALRGRR